MRNLLILILVFIIAWWAQRALSEYRRKKSVRGGPKGKVVGNERMLACDHCGVHIPESEGVRNGSDFFCSQEHKRLGAKR